MSNRRGMRKATKAPRRVQPGGHHGWSGWDEYAAFYDWENARTLGRKDVPFWKRIAASVDGPVLELGCGTGRLSLPLVRAGASLVGVDRSAPMLAKAARRGKRLPRTGRGPQCSGLRLVRADIRALPFAAGEFHAVIAPYGMLQSLICERDLQATLVSVARVLEPGGLFGIDLVPDVPRWPEYSDRVQLRGPSAGGKQVTLIESVRQDPRRKLTIFTQRYRERRGRTSAEHCFDLIFRTLPIPQMTKRLERAGFEIEAVLGDYRGRPWDRRADVWVILARKRRGVRPSGRASIW